MCQHCGYGFVVFLRQGMADDQHLKIPLVSWINESTVSRVCVQLHCLYLVCNDMLQIFRFVCKNNGVIFENQLLQIGLKSEYRQNLGELLSDTTYLHHACFVSLKLHYF